MCFVKGVSMMVQAESVIPSRTNGGDWRIGIVIFMKHGYI